MQVERWFFDILKYSISAMVLKGTVTVEIPVFGYEFFSARLEIQAEDDGYPHIWSIIYLWGKYVSST